MGVFKYSRLDFLFTCVGLPFFLLDVVLDVLAAVNFYQEKAYFSLGVLLFFLVGSSVLAQVYSWLWYSYDQFEMKTKVEKCLSLTQLKVCHIFQLAIYFRHAGVLESSVNKFCSKREDPENPVVYLSHDLAMLRLFETFSESAPQIVLMLTIILQEGRLDLLTVLKAVASASTVAFCVTTYHRSLRSFLPDKKKQTPISSVVYFLWNLLLISARLVALALFASVLPCFIFTHFICSWLILFFCAWTSQTSFMESPFGEWLYRTTVGLIWYFNWFSVVEGKTLYRTLLYHTFILVDISMLCSVWCWKMNTDPPDFAISPLPAVITAVCVVLVYIFGLLFKVLYYKFFHPNLASEELKGDSTSVQSLTERDEVDFRMFRATVAPQASASCNKRMRQLAGNFYS